MSTVPQSVQTEMLARQLKHDEEAREALSKEHSKRWFVAVVAFISLLQGVFGRQVEQYLEVSPPAAWFLVVALAAIVFLVAEVADLRRQVKALYYLHNRGEA